MEISCRLILHIGYASAIFHITYIKHLQVKEIEAAMKLSSFRERIHAESAALTANGRVTAIKAVTNTEY
jgi:hypothetical protein